MKTSSFPIPSLRFLLIVMCTLLCGTINAQNTFYKVYGTSNEDAVFNHKECADGGHYLIGNTNTNTFRYDSYIMRTDVSGNILWNKIIHFDSIGVHLSGGGMLDDESYVLIYKEYNPFFQPMTILLKMSPSGDSLWTKFIYGFEAVYTSEPLIPLSNGEFLLGGRYQTFMGDIYNGCVMKFDSDGNRVFQTSYNSEYEDVIVYDYAITPDSEIVSVGYIMEHIVSHPEYSFLMKCDMNGNFISSELYTDSTGMTLINIHPNQDHTYSIFAAGRLLLTTDTSGTILQSKVNTGTDYVYEMIDAPDSGYFMSGIHYTGTGYNAGLARTNFSFDTLWTKTYLAESSSAGLTVNPTDHSISFVSSIDTITNLFGETDIVMLHLDSAGNSFCYGSGPMDINFQPHVNTIVGFDSTFNYYVSGPSINPPTWHQITFQSGILEDTICSPLGISESVNNNSILLFPNPVSGNTFHLMIENINDTEFLLMGLDGKIISGLRKEKVDGKGIKFSIPSELANGIYFLKMRSKDLESSLKIVVMR